MWFLEFIKEMVAVPAILIGFFTLIGGLLQKKKTSELITSVFKVMIGLLIFSAGAGVIVSALNSFGPIFNNVFGVSGIIPTNEGVSGAMQNSPVATVASLIMIASMGTNLLLAAVSRFKYVFLSGHIMYFFSLMCAIIFYKSGMDVENNAGDFILAVVSGAMIFGIYMVLQPASSQTFMKHVTGTSDIALGHTGTILGYVVSGFIGKGISKMSKKPIFKTEDIEFPNHLSFLRNTMVSVPITMLVFYLAAYIPAGILHEMGDLQKTYDSSGNIAQGFPNAGAQAGKATQDAIDVFGGKNWLATSIIQAMTFAAGMEIIVFGVRTFLGELIPTFKGFSDKLIKNVKPAVDVPVLFPFAPNAVMIGFISAFGGQIIGLGITISISAGAGTPVILPSVINSFFAGAGAAVFGNLYGGVKGSIIGALLLGITASFVPLIFIVGEWNSKNVGPKGADLLAWGDPDFLFGAILGVIAWSGKWVMFSVISAIFSLILIDGIIARYKKWGVYNPKSKNLNSLSFASLNQTPADVLAVNKKIHAANKKKKENKKSH